MERPYVIDADGHITETQKGVIDWEARFPLELKHKAPHYLDFETMGGRVFLEGKIYPRAYLKARRIGGKDIYDIHRGRPGMYQGTPRIKDMDDEGIDVSVVFGGAVYLGVSGIKDAAVARAVARVYNDWCAGFCDASPQRLKGVACLPVMDVHASLEEMHRAVGELGLVSVNLPHNANGMTLDNPYYEPFFAEAELLGIPVCVHGAVGIPGIEAPSVERFDKYYFSTAGGFPFELMMAMCCVTAEGALDRHPRLRVGILEGWAGWLPFWLERLDEHYEMMSDQIAAKAKPSEYLRSGQVYVSCDAREETIPYVIERCGENCLLYASDYWHADASYFGSVNAIWTRKDLTESAKQKLLSGNAKRFYGLR